MQPWCENGQDIIRDIERAIKNAHKTPDPPRCKICGTSWGVAWTNVIPFFKEHFKGNYCLRCITEASLRKGLITIEQTKPYFGDKYVGWTECETNNPKKNR